MNNAAVKACRCDLCSKQEVGIEYFHLDTPVLFVGRCCQPREVADLAAIIIAEAVLEAVFDLEA
jgi:hypothetical protein